MTVGDIVLIKTENEPRNEWLMGRVTKVYPDEEGIVRSILLKTQRGAMERPIHKVVLVLPEGN